MANSIPAPRFKVGQRIKAVAFVNCFGKQVEEVPNLTVESVTLHSGIGIESYYRVFACDYAPFAPVRSVEGAERYFEVQS